MLRACNPLDLAALELSRSRLKVNLAQGRRAIASGREHALPLGALAAEWLPRSKSLHAWIATRRFVPTAVVSAYRRGGQNWEIDHLHLTGSKPGTAQTVIDALTLALGKLGGERLFLRLSARGSQSVALEGRFDPLVRERLYFRQPGAFSTPAPAEDVRIRPPVEADTFNLFRLYHRAVPAPIRQFEGVTLDAWRGTPDIAGGLPVSDGLVFDFDGKIEAAAAISGNGSRRVLDVLINPDRWEAAAPLIARLTAQHGLGSTLVVILPEYLWRTGQTLESMGFEPADLTHLYVKPIVARVREVGLLPVGA